jgi:hypothetical protein
MFEVEYFQLNSTDTSNHYVALAGTPLSPTNVALDTIGGTAQAINGDFGVDGTKVKWDSTSYTLFSQLNDGDSIRVIYDKS